MRSMLITLALVCAACDKPEDPAVRAARDRTDIIAQVNASAAAIRTKNIDVYMDQLPDEAMDIRDENGAKLGRDELRERVLRSWAAVEETRALNVVVDSVQVQGDSATLISMMRWDRIVRDTAKNGRDTVVTLLRQREHWKRTPKGWRAYNIETLAQSAMVNGKPVTR
jgi:hypothetical protein